MATRVNKGRRLTKLDVEDSVDLGQIVEDLREHPNKVLLVTQGGKRALAIMTWDEYEALLETVEILADKKLMTSIRQGTEELRQGKGVPWETVKAELGL